MIMSGLSKGEARGVEQVMISAYTLDALDNARREIAFGNIAGAGREGARAARILASYPENEWLDFIGR